MFSLGAPDYVVFWKNKLEHFSWKKKLTYAVEGKGDSQWHILYFFSVFVCPLEYTGKSVQRFKKTVHIEECFQKVSMTVLI